jgi:hypothetical protein
MADFVLLIHDGLSKGTANEFEEVRKAKKPHKYIVMNPTDVKTQREISVDILDREKPNKNDEFLTLKY